MLDENDVVVVGSSSSAVQLSPKFNDYIEQDILINLSETFTDKVYTLEAETLGGQTARKAMKVSVDTGEDNTADCHFSIAPSQKGTVLKYLTPDEVGAENVKKRAKGLEPSSL